MAIFSRRILQRLINENDKFLSKKQTEKHVKELNQVSKNLTLAFEWEVVLLNVFSKLGKVKHELLLGNGKDADVYFETAENPNVNFTADITTASDKGLDENNPFDALDNELDDIVSKLGLNPNHFDLKVGSTSGNTYKGGPKIKLILPGRARFKQIIFNNDFDKFISLILDYPNSNRVYRIKNSDADVRITYQPNQRFSSGSFPSYSEVFRITENTVYTALESKVKKFTDAKVKSNSGIFLCDNGCSLFHQGSTLGLSYSIHEIIHHFLKNNKEIDFVVTFTTNREHFYGYSSFEKNPYLVYINFYKGVNYDDKIKFNLSTIFESAAEVFPEPENTPYNAINHLKGGNPNIGSSHSGGLEVSYGEKTMSIKISARALLELLAGKVEQKDFFETHRFIPSELYTSPPFINPFEVGMNKGQLIDEISIEKSDVEDDDWITLKLSQQDAAISPFVVPESDSKQK